MSDWLTQLREAVEGYDKFIKPKDRPWQLAAVVDAGRLLASGRRPDKEEGVRYVREVLEIPASWLTTGDVHQLIDAAFGGSDVLIVDIPTDTDLG